VSEELFRDMAQRIRTARGHRRFGVVEAVRGRDKRIRRFRGNVRWRFPLAIGTVALAPLRIDGGVYRLHHQRALLCRHTHGEHHRAVVLPIPPQRTSSVAAKGADGLLQTFDMTIRTHQLLDVGRSAVARDHQQVVLALGGDHARDRARRTHVDAAFPVEPVRTREHAVLLPRVAPIELRDQHQ